MQSEPSALKAAFEAGKPIGQLLPIRIDPGVQFDGVEPGCPSCGTPLALAAQRGILTQRSGREVVLQAIARCEQCDAYHELTLGMAGLYGHVRVNVAFNAQRRRLLVRSPAFGALDVQCIHTAVFFAGLLIILGGLAPVEAFGLCFAAAFVLRHRLVATF